MVGVYQFCGVFSPINAYVNVNVHLYRCSCLRLQTRQQDFESYARGGKLNRKRPDFSIIFDIMYIL